MRLDDFRLTVMLKLREKTALPLDVSEWLTRGLSYRSLAILDGNLSTLPPQYSQSKGTE